VYRVGGEEFVVLLPYCDLRGGCRVAERLRRAVQAASIPHDGRPEIPTLTISVGVASGSGPSLDMARVVHVANREMRRAKAAGRNGVFPQLDPPVDAA
jgi:diguanylate cyclase (GGDEF)-like protein